MKNKALLFLAIVLVLAIITAIVSISLNNSVKSSVGNPLLLGGMFLFGWTIITLNRIKKAN